MMASENKFTAPLYFALEISTQQVKVIVVDDGLNVVYENGVRFDAELPEFGQQSSSLIPGSATSPTELISPTTEYMRLAYTPSKTEGGVHGHKDGKTFTAPTLMWIKAVDLVLQKMKESGFEFGNVVAISGTAQQHGSVYWKSRSKETLSSIEPSRSFHDQLKDCFSIYDSPIWMDSSTDEQCENVERKLGGPLKLSEITGCRAYHRITGNQIAKIHQYQNHAYNNTERIGLVSSFAASLFIGDYAPIDESDGSGMNLLDLHTRQWSVDCLKAYGVEHLVEKLGPVVPSNHCIGTVSTYLVKRYGFPPDCKVIAFTGDNPASLAGMRPDTGDIIMSLGTSDTLLLWLDEPRACLEGLVLVNPLETKDYMGMLCFKNGSLTREKIRKNCGIDNWSEFERLLNTSPPGNNGNIGIYFDVPEITPSAVGILRLNSNDELVDSFEPATEIRALIEGQFMAKRVHAENIGYILGQVSRILATGGASSNKAVLQVLSDVFKAPVFVQEVANSACLGSAYRAKHGYLGGSVSFQEVVRNASLSELNRCATPNEKVTPVKLC